MDHLIELGQLYAYYGSFLTKRQSDLVDAYANENLSLGEIAEREGISRQGVRDGIVRAEQQLREAEQHLGLIEKNAKLRLELERLLALAKLLPQEAEQRKEIMAGVKTAISLLEEDDGI